MSANQFIALLEEQGLLDTEVLEELRRSVTESKNRITAESLSKLLVENGQLTRFQATRLVGQLKDPTGVIETAKPVAKSNFGSDDGLDLLPDVEADQPLQAKLIDQPSSAPSKSSSKTDEVEVVEEIIEGVAVVEEKSDASAFDSEPTFVKPVKIGAPKGNQWDAFRIWGVGFFLSVLLVLLAWLVYWLLSGSASQFYKLAEESYESRDYEVAVERFSSYVKSYPKADNVSVAKVFAAIATIRQANEQLGDPAKAIELAETVLPTVVNEPA